MEHNCIVSEREQAHKNRDTDRNVVIKNAAGVNE
jgi:hypothetical protein